MGNLAITYQHIADILSFESSNFELEKNLSHPDFDWDSIVIEGSKHLVLPTIYCRLNAKKLLHELPQDLNNYLEEITSINRNRNRAILNQINALSKLLNEHNIKHVFLKGAALLSTDFYTDIAERMIGDIDILIEPIQLEKANHLLKNNGYDQIELTLREQFFEHKHLPRLKPTEHICSVELHKKLFNSYQNDEIKIENILHNRITFNQIYTPSKKHLLMHNILNFQINDKGSLYKSISFRSVYDTIVLQRNYDGESSWYHTNNFKQYFKFSSLFFNEFTGNTQEYKSLSASFYLFKLKHIQFYKLWNRSLLFYNFIPLLLRRLSFFMSNKSYRSAIINDRKRIYKYFRAILFKI